MESFSNAPSTAPPIPGASTDTYNADNQIQSVEGGSAPAYDASGDVTTDTQGQQYLYDAEGRICAVNGLGGMFGYLYDAEGNRIAKGTISNWSAGCNTAANGFQPTASYILGPDNQQLTELAWSGGTAQWTGSAHTNIWTAGQLAATYSVDSTGQTAGILNFYLTDWLGTRRTMTDYEGNVQETCHSLPYGNGEDCAPTPTEHLFTQKERDVETGGTNGNDYFGARYYASSMGRFLSPDWSASPTPVPYAALGDPQSLNLFAYVTRNPITRVDPDGHCSSWTYLSVFAGQVVDQGSGGDDTDCVDLSVAGLSSFWAGGFVNFTASNPVSQSITNYYNSTAAPNNGTGCNATQAVNFIQAHQADAATVANQLGVPTQNVLGLSGIESQWSTSNAAVQANNFFGLHGGANAPFATGGWYTSGGVAMSSFPLLLGICPILRGSVRKLCSGRRESDCFCSGLGQSRFQSW